jgi:hypothetical protein
VAEEPGHESRAEVLEGAGGAVEELKDVRILRDLSHGNVEGKRLGA